MELVLNCELLDERTFLKPRDQLTVVSCWFGICRPLHLSGTALNTRCQPIALVGYALVMTKKPSLSWSLPDFFFFSPFLLWSPLAHSPIYHTPFSGVPASKLPVRPLQLRNPRLAFHLRLRNEGKKQEGEGGHWPALSIAFTCGWARSLRRWRYFICLSGNFQKTFTVQIRVSICWLHSKVVCLWGPFL